MRVLVIEDDPRLAEPVADDLRRQNYVVDLARDGDEGLAYAETGSYDVIILDLMLPGRDGMSVCREMRRRQCEARVLIVTGRHAVADKVAALDSGADDYLVKPFDLAELSARLRALARRGLVWQDEELERNGLRLQPRNGRAFYRDVPLALTPTELALLELLMRQPQRVFSRAALQRRVADFEGDGARDAIRTHILNLRRKLQAAGCRAEAIVTHRGFGYRLGEG